MEGVCEGRVEVGGAGAPGSGQWEGGKELVIRREGKYKEKGGEGASGRKDKREGAHLHFFPNKIKSPDWSFRAGRWSSLCILEFFFYF